MLFARIFKTTDWEYTKSKQQYAHARWPVVKDKKSISKTQLPNRTSIEFTSLAEVPNSVTF